MLDAVVVELDREYSAKHGNHFPVTGDNVGSLARGDV